jgi:hypothetical protein
MEKMCTRCKSNKHISFFGKNKTKKDGHQSQCKPCCKEIFNEWRIKFGTSNKRVLEWQKANPEKHKAKNERYKTANIEKVRASKARWARDNPGLVNAKTARRRAKILKASPPWLNESHQLNIKQYYNEANLLTVQTGTEHHVDHIVPLQGRNVCGLHVPWNLQVITAKENYRKSNKL